MKADIMWFGSTDSTNEEAKRRISDIDNLSVLSALEQTEGRGQRGNQWHSAPGENLLFSIVLKYRKDGMLSDGLSPVRACDQFVINETAALAVTDFLSGYGIQAKIKWPNDIYVADRKICGILIEHSIRGEWLSHSIIGIGLNINQRNFDVNLLNPTSISLQTGLSYDIREGLEDFIDVFTAYLKRYLNITGGYLKLRKMYLSQLWRKDIEAAFIDYTTLPSGHLDDPMNISSPKDHTTSTTSYINSPSQTGKVFQGIIKGLSPTGNLLVQDLSTGQIREFGFKEIGYIL
ncbi:MAG: biotin--[Bacteroidales bacterium]|nr:biotin--[acetyl-CoA-carboxylase] ligase [Bacteroidales bacterium]